MMRQLLRSIPETTKPGRTEPMAEGIHKEHKPWGFYPSKSGKEVLEIAGRFIEEKGITNPKGLEKADRGLYEVLSRRGLLEKVKFQERQKQRRWGTDEEVLAIAREYLKKEGIRNRKGLENADDGLYQVLRKRKLLDKLEFEKKREQREPRKWGTDGEVLDFAKRLIEKKILNRKGLEKADYGLYQVLRKRKLLDGVKFEERQEHRRWGTDGEVLEYARRFIEEKGVKNRRGLEKADSGLYRVLHDRKLIDKLKFEERRETREWGTDAELLGIAGKFMEKNDIWNRAGLQKADIGLYMILVRRKLLDQVFASIDHAKHKAAVQGVLDAMDSFGDDR